LENVKSPSAWKSAPRLTLASSGSAL